MADAPETSWRVVFLLGLVPAAVAFLVRLFVVLFLAAASTARS
jgi:hypothetical protein